MTEQNSQPWLSRNWKWLVPSGCLVVAILFAGFAAVIVTFVMGLMKSSAAYTGAMERARASSAVVEALGEPIEEGWFTTGSINTSGPSGDADLAIPLSGPRSKATLYVVATKRAGEWEFETLQVEVKAGERIDLLSEPGKP